MKRGGLSPSVGTVMHFALVFIVLVIVLWSPRMIAMGSEKGGQVMGASKGQAVIPDESFETLMKDALAAAYRAVEKAPVTGDPDHDFVVTMIPHHKGSIDVAKVILREGTDKDVREFAETMIEDRQAEIEIMTGWLKRYTPPEGEGPNTTFATALRSIRSTLNQDRGDSEKTRDPDREFLRIMIPHHQFAVDMAKLVHMYGRDSEIRRLADQIIAAQQSDIQMMRRWLSALEE